MVANESDASFVSVASVSMNVFWAGYNIALLVPIVRAAVFRPPPGWKPEPPAYLVSGVALGSSEGSR